MVQSGDVIQTDANTLWRFARGTQIRVEFIGSLSLSRQKICAIDVLQRHWYLHANLSTRAALEQNNTCMIQLFIFYLLSFIFYRMPRTS